MFISMGFLYFVLFQSHIIFTRPTTKKAHVKQLLGTIIGGIVPSRYGKIRIMLRAE